ncbi:hypothetical protein RBU55_06045 [Pseudomonas chlororaphis subsp. aurantiaca]|uniref:hypothetical protein n=1 Tax=Pseudomonas chlororaphis TaxID=587753 RepID=UPI001CF300E0|nr:hypothetical protein [Pseudomonas chlororaphis]UCR87664.1 hypothetical protein K9V45_10010 [Pseudomonas chlororaphis]WMJ03150.1 hypothetical protein RBU55_06045 [Pseudomonas chlororaphis subsp. aurantiaca]
MIQRSASGTFDLELCILADPGEQSFAMSTSAIFQHLQCLVMFIGSFLVHWPSRDEARYACASGRHSKKPGNPPGFSVMRSFAVLSSCEQKEADFSALLARYESIQIVFPTAVPARRITALGALRCTPGSVANPLNRRGRFIAAFAFATKERCCSPLSGGLE